MVCIYVHLYILMKVDLDLNAKPCELFKKVFHQFIWTKIFVFNNLNVIMKSPHM